MHNFIFLLLLPEEEDDVASCDDDDVPFKVSKRKEAIALHVYLC